MDNSENNIEIGKYENKNRFEYDMNNTEKNKNKYKKNGAKKYKKV